MLATLGFLATGLCFALFAFTFNSKVIAKTKLPLRQFSYAYYCLALALITWGIAAWIGGNDLLANSVIIGNAFLILGTLFMISVLLKPKEQGWLLTAGLIGAFLLYLRAENYPPAPYMQDGILIFNTETAVALVLASIFLFIWLPVNLRVAKQVAHSIKQDGIASLYSYIYIAATLSALIFIASRRVLTIVLSFIALGICFLLLLASNFLVSSVKEKRAAPKRTTRKPA